MQQGINPKVLIAIAAVTVLIVVILVVRSMTAPPSVPAAANPGGRALNPYADRMQGSGGGAVPPGPR